jgi:hypothetical protein
MWVNIANWAGFHAGCVIYAQANTTADIRRPSPGLASQGEGLTTQEDNTFPPTTGTT